MNTNNAPYLFTDIKEEFINILNKKEAFKKAGPYLHKTKEEKNCLDENVTYKVQMSEHHSWPQTQIYIHSCKTILDFWNRMFF